MLITAEGMLVVPHWDGTGQPVIIDMAEIVKGKSRFAEIARVNPATGPGLLAFFLGCWQGLHDAYTDVVNHRDRCIDSVKRAKAEALLSADERIKLKGGKPSADLREAIVVLDEDVKKAQELLYEIEACVSWVKGRKDEFEAAWRSVRTLVEKEKTPPPRLSGDGPAPAPFGADSYAAAAAFEETKIQKPASELPPGLIGSVNYNRY